MKRLFEVLFIEETPQLWVTFCSSIPMSFWTTRVPEVPYFLKQNSRCATAYTFSLIFLQIQDMHDFFLCSSEFLCCTLSYLLISFHSVYFSASPSSSVSSGWTWTMVKLYTIENSRIFTVTLVELGIQSFPPTLSTQGNFLYKLKENELFIDYVNST